MEEEIQDRLKEIYTFEIEVQFKDFRIYEIVVNIDVRNGFSFSYLYNAQLTFEANIKAISNRIDSQIIDYFKRKEVKND